MNSFDRLVAEGTTIALAVVGIAMLAVFVSKNNQTPKVIAALTGGFSDILTAAGNAGSGTGVGNLSINTYNPGF